MSVGMLRSRKAHIHLFMYVWIYLERSTIQFYSVGRLIFSWRNLAMRSYEEAKETRTFSDQN